MQFDLFVNPIASARKSYPYVVKLQSDLLSSATEQIVAPLIPKSALGSSPDTLAPTVSVNAVDHVVLVHSMSVMRRRDLDHRIASLSDSRSALLAAVDYLFFGV